MMEMIEYVLETIWPRPVRKVLNKCASRLNRVWQVEYTDNPDAPMFMEDEGKVLLLLPSAFANAATNPGGFKCVSLGAKYRVYYGVINSVLPSDMSMGDIPPFTATPGSSTGVICAAVTVSDVGDSFDGVLDTTHGSVAIADFPTMPPDSEPVFYLQLGSFTTAGGTLIVTPGGTGNGVGDQTFELCGGLGGNKLFGPA